MRTFYKSIKYEGGSCIRKPTYNFDYSKKIIINNIKLGESIIINNIPYKLISFKVNKSIGTYNYGGIMGPQNTSFLYNIYKLNDGNEITFVFIKMLGILYDKNNLNLEGHTFKYITHKSEIYYEDNK